MNNTGKKFGGREKGTPNKLTSTVRAQLYDVLRGETPRLAAALQELEGVDLVRAYAMLLPYVAPRIAPVNTYADKRGPYVWDTTNDFDGLTSQSMELQK